MDVEVSFHHAVHDRPVGEKARLEPIVGPQVVEARPHRDELHSRSGNEALVLVVSVDRLTRLDALHQHADGGSQLETPSQRVELLRERILRSLGETENGDYGQEKKEEDETIRETLFKRCYLSRTTLEASA